jgi:hypothetical protein
MLSKSDVLALLALPDKEFVQATAMQILEASPAENVMIIMAQPNLDMQMRVAEALADKPRGGDLPRDLDGTILFISEILDDTADEIGIRRLSWFLMASLVKRANQLAECRPELHEAVCLMWAKLAEAGKHIYQIAPNIMLWSDEEKEYFSEIDNAKDGVDYVYYVLMPDWVRETPALRQLKPKLLISNG